MRKCCFYFFTLLLFSCTKDRDFDSGNPPPVDTAFTVGSSGMLKINEFVASGSLNYNEFGTAEDWFEIYNTSSSVVNLEAGKWFVTDDHIAGKHKYALPELHIAAHDFVIIWCDSRDTVADFIHTGFNLSASGEDLGIFFDNNGTDVEIDTYTYPTQNSSGKSSGRYPDGSGNWILFDIPTPGESNH